MKNYNLEKDICDTKSKEIELDKKLEAFFGYVQALNDPILTQIFKSAEFSRSLQRCCSGGEFYYHIWLPSEFKKIDPYLKDRLPQIESLFQEAMFDKKSPLVNLKICYEPESKD